MRVHALALAVLAAACAAPSEGADEAASAASAELVQMNDVSLLFPLAKSKAAFDRGYLTPASEARGGELLPSAPYEKAFGAPGSDGPGGTPGAPLLSGLKLVSVRLDPCFGPACQSQIRLVFQTLKLQGREAVAVDDGVHASYRLTRAELDDAVAKMVALRRTRGGDRRLGPLRPHPLLTTSAGDLDIPAAREVAALVTSLAGAQNLVRVTQFTANTGGAQWNFSGFDVDKGTRLAMPGLPEGNDTFTIFFAGFTKGELEGDPAFAPASAAPKIDNMQVLGNRLTAEAAGPAARQQAFSAMLRLENPDLHTPDTTDCASCHAVEPVRHLIGERHFAADLASARGGFVADARFVAAEDLARTPSSDDVNVHMFSYKGATPSVHTRTVNETAAVVAKLNGGR